LLVAPLIHFINILFPSPSFLLSNTFSRFFSLNWQLTPTKQQGVCTSAQQNIKDEVANRSTEKEDKFQSCESLMQKEQPEICCATILSDAQTLNTKLQFTDGTNSTVPVSSSVCDPMHIDGMTNQTEDSNTSALVEINHYQAPKNPISDHCKNRFSPLLTFRRRVKKRASSAEPTEEHISPDNKQCLTSTCNLPRSSQDATHLLKHTNGKSSDIEPKVCFPVMLTCISVMMCSRNNNNQTFYSQASWGRLEMKPHKPKKRYKTKAKKKEKIKGDKKIKSKKEKRQ
jgi:hypothetical protein